MDRKKSGVDRLRDALYSRSAAPSIDPNARTPLSPEPPHAHAAMQDIAPQGSEAPLGIETFERSTHMSPKELRPKRSPTSVLLIGSAAFFFLAAAVAAYTFFAGGNTISPQNIDLDIVAPALVDAGKNVTLQFVIGNRNAEDLQSADLIVDYPEGARDATDPTKALSHDRIPLGDIGTGKQLKQTVSALFFGQEGTQEQLHATLEYQLKGSNAIFTKETNTVFTIGSSPVSVTVDSPAQVISGQEFTMTVNVRSNATTPVEDVALQGQYPFGYQVDASNPASGAGNLWHLGELQPGESKNIQLVGILTGEDGDARVFHFITGSESDPNATAIQVPILSQPVQLTVQKPFISGAIALNGQTGETIPVPVGKTVNGSVTWTNNIGETISNVTLTLQLQGSLIDPSSVQAGQGFYDSSNNQIVWSSQQDPSLATVQPNQSGNYQFSFATYPPSTRTAQNPQLKLNLSVHGSRQVQGSAPEDVSSAASVTAPLSSAVSLSAQAEHFSGAYSDSGPVPPIVNQPTQYTLVWTVSNSSNTIANASVSAVLPLNVEYVQGDSAVSYDSGSRTVSWSIGDYKPGTRSATFQVTLTPSASQVGQAPQLLGSSNFSGTDRFSQSRLSASADQVTTVLTESGFKYGVQTVSAQ